MKSPGSAGHRTARRRSGLVAAVAAVAGLVGVTAPVAADPGVRTGVAACPRPVLMVHDMSGSPAQMRAFATRLGLAGPCTVIADYGRTAASTLIRNAGGGDVAGLTAVDVSAAQLGTLMRRAAPRAVGWTVIAHGAGGLAVQRAIQRGLTGARVAHLITVGPIWRGTNVARLADIEDLSRRLGTYDAVLAVEKPLVDPLCGGCRELVRGSDLLVRLHRAGLPTPGVRYSDVISSADALVSDPLSAVVPGVDSRVIGATRGRPAPHHFALLSDPRVTSIVRDSVGGS